MRTAQELSNIRPTGYGGVIPIPVWRPVSWTTAEGNHVVHEFSEDLEKERDIERMRQAVAPGSPFMDAVLEFAEALRRRVHTWNGEPARGIVLTNNMESAQVVREGLNRQNWAAIPEDSIPRALPADVLVWGTETRGMQLFQQVTNAMLTTFYKRPQNRDMFLIYPADRRLNGQVEMHDHYIVFGEYGSIMEGVAGILRFLLRKESSSRGGRSRKSLRFAIPGPQGDAKMGHTTRA
ncbi:MAG: hypothetical protein AB1646_11730 [Thermodesulfobacteriota bacterium]